MSRRYHDAAYTQAGRRCHRHRAMIAPGLAMVPGAQPASVGEVGARPDNQNAAAAQTKHNTPRGTLGIRFDKRREVTWLVTKTASPRS